MSISFHEQILIRVFIVFIGLSPKHNTMQLFKLHLTGQNSCGLDSGSQSKANMIAFRYIVKTDF